MLYLADPLICLLVRATMTTLSPKEALPRDECDIILPLQFILELYHYMLVKISFRSIIYFFLMSGIAKITQHNV